MRVGVGARAAANRSGLLLPRAGSWWCPATPAADDGRQRPDGRGGPTQPPRHPSGQHPQRGQDCTLSHAGQAIDQPAELDHQRAQPGHQHRRADLEPAPPVPHGGVRHPKPRGHRAQPHPGRHPLQRRTDHPDHVQASKQRKRWQQRMRHTAPPTPGPDHPHPPDTAAAVTQIPLIARPEPHRPATVRAARPRDPHPTARSRILLDAARARPYDGHGDQHRLDPPGAPTPMGGSFACSGRPHPARPHESVPNQRCRSPGLHQQPVTPVTRDLQKRPSERRFPAYC